MNKQVKNNITKWTMLLLFAFGVFLIFFLSWKTNPNLKETLFIPEWLSSWTDHAGNGKRRTAVPFIGLGLLVGAYMIYRKRTALVFWFFAWLVLVFIVGVAEVGQYFLPARHVDIKDIFWGGIGAWIGLMFAFFAWQLVCILNTIHFGNKKE